MSPGLEGYKLLNRPRIYHGALALLIIVLGSRIPVPGLNITALADQSIYAFNNWSARYSIMALGVMPLLTVLAHMEMAKLLAPSFAKWLDASPVNTHRVNIIVVLMIILITAAQGYGVQTALATLGLTDGSTFSTVAVISSLVGASILLIWLATLIRTPGLASGLWFLMAIFVLMELPGAVTEIFELMRFATGPLIVLIILGAALAVAGALVVSAMKLLLQGTPHGRIDSVPSLSILLWPPFLANIVTGYVLAIILGNWPGFLAREPWFIDVVMLIATGILIPLFAYAYLRLIIIGDQSGIEFIVTLRKILLPVTVIQVLICAGFVLLNRVLLLPLLPQGGTFIVFVSMVLMFYKGQFSGTPERTQ